MNAPPDPWKQVLPAKLHRLIHNPSSARYLHFDSLLMLTETFFKHLYMLLEQERTTMSEYGVQEGVSSFPPDREEVRHILEGCVSLGQMRRRLFRWFHMRTKRLRPGLPRTECACPPHPATVDGRVPPPHPMMTKTPPSCWSRWRQDHPMRMGGTCGWMWTMTTMSNRGDGPRQPPQPPVKPSTPIAAVSPSGEGWRTGLAHGATDRRALAA